MPRGKTKSKLSKYDRKAKSFELFAKGFGVNEVAQELEVTRQTASSYKKQHDERIANEARNNPGLLKNVLENTVRSLEELDRIRVDAWKRVVPRKSKEVVICDECGHRNKVVFYHEPSDQSVSSFHNVLLKAQDQRAKLFGVLGVKQDVLVMVLQVKAVQDRLLEFMVRGLCEEDKQKLATLLESPEMRQYMGMPELPDPAGIIDVESEEEVV